MSYDSHGMLSLKQACHNKLSDSLMAQCINLICAHDEIDCQNLPEDLQSDIQKQKDRLNDLLSAVLNGQKCTVHYCEKHIHSLACVPELIQSGADLFTTNCRGQSALHVASMKNDVSLLKFLLERCPLADIQSFIHEKDSDGNTPLHCAVITNANDSMDILIKAGADVCAHNEYSRSPLHVAAESNAIEAMQLLLKSEQVDINALDYEGNTPLHLAAHLDNFKAVEFLLKGGAQSVTNECGETPLDLAYTLGMTKSAQLLKH